MILLQNHLAQSSGNKKIKLITPLSNYWKKKSRYSKFFICSLYLFKFLVSNKDVLIFSFQGNAYATILAKLFGNKNITRSNSSSEG